MKKTEVSKPPLGWSKIPNFLIENQHNLSGPALRLILIILRYQKAYPSYRIIRKMTGLSRDSISRAKKELVAKNIITVVQGDSHRSNFYAVKKIEDWKFDCGLANEPRNSVDELPLSNDWSGSGSPDGPIAVESSDHIKTKKKEQSKERTITKEVGVSASLKDKPMDRLQLKRQSFLQDLNTVLRSNRFFEAHKKLETLLHAYGFVYDEDEIIAIFETQFPKHHKLRDRMISPLNEIMERAYQKLDYESDAESRTRVDYRFRRDCYPEEEDLEYDQEESERLADELNRKEWRELGTED